MLLRLAYLGVTNAFALLRLLSMSDRDKDMEILALRHQITVLERQLDKTRPQFSPGDRAFLAALLHRLPVATLRRLRLLVRPETILRWHRDLLDLRHAATSRPTRPGRSRTIRSIRLLVLRLARENPAWGYRRIMANYSSSASQSPRPPSGRSSKTPGSPRLPSAPLRPGRPSSARKPRHYWPATSSRQIRDRDGKFPALFDDILADAGIQVVLTGVRIPRMNAIMERWIHSCRHKLLDRTLIWNQPHLLHALHEYEKYYNTHRPHQGIANTRPLQPDLAQDR